VPGYQAKEGETSPNVDNVNPGYFAAIGMTLIAGREFRLSDTMAAPRVAVVNQTFAKAYFADSNPIGRQFYFSSDSTTPVEIVGVVKDSKYADVREDKQRFIFCPYAQHYSAGVGGAITYYVRTVQAPASVGPELRQVVREADASLPVFDLKTMERQIDEDIFSDRIVSLLSVFFGALATALAGIGLYGLLAYSVTRRTREIGIRMALGAGRGQVLRLILREIAVLAGLGIAIAAPLAFPLSALAKSMLFGVAPGNGWAVAAGAAVLGLTAVLAAAVPALRAMGVDPLTALRND
jgi:putative ABC transport system permease protein